LHRECAELHREGLGHYEAANAIFEQLDAEIEQQANFAPRESQIGEHLSLVNWSDLLNDLKLYDHFSLYKQINAVSLI
jgi:hypothetical protein